MDRILCILLQTYGININDHLKDLECLPIACHNPLWYWSSTFPGCLTDPSITRFRRDCISSNNPSYTIQWILSDLHKNMMDIEHHTVIILSTRSSRRFLRTGCSAYSQNISDLNLWIQRLLEKLDRYANYHNSLPRSSTVFFMLLLNFFENLTLRSTSFVVNLDLDVQYLFENRLRNEIVISRHTCKLRKIFLRSEGCHLFAIIGSTCWSRRYNSVVSKASSSAEGSGDACRSSDSFLLISVSCHSKDCT